MFKHCIMIMMTAFSLSGKAQTAPGMYKSGPGSYQQNFCFIIEGDSITLLAWHYGSHIESNRTYDSTPDTIYYRSKALFDEKMDHITFNGFDVSRKPYIINGRLQFTPQKLDSFFYSELVFHKYWHIQKTGDTLRAAGVKDIYDGRADSFYFTKFK